MVPSIYVIRIEHGTSKSLFSGIRMEMSHIKSHVIVVGSKVDGLGESRAMQDHAR